MPATSLVTSRVGKESPSLAAKDRTARASEGSSAFTPTRCRPVAASADRYLSRRWTCSRLAGESVIQKESRTKLPRNDCRVRGFPSRSGNEKSGAWSGSISHVSDDDGNDSGFKGSLAWAYAAGGAPKGFRS